jgi:hypothetical protein
MRAASIGVHARVRGMLACLLAMLSVAGTLAPSTTAAPSVIVRRAASTPAPAPTSALFVAIDGAVSQRAAAALHGALISEAHFAYDEQALVSTDADMGAPAASVAAALRRVRIPLRAPLPASRVGKTALWSVLADALAHSDPERWGGLVLADAAAVAMWRMDTPRAAALFPDRPECAVAALFLETTPRDGYSEISVFNVSADGELYFPAGEWGRETEIDRHHHTHTHTYTHSLSHSHKHSHTQSHTHSLTHSLTLKLKLKLTHTTHTNDSPP